MNSKLTPSLKRVIEWGFIGKKVIESKKKRDEIANKRKCYRRTEYKDLEAYKKLQCSGRMKLDSFERAMRLYFTKTNMKLGYMQERLVKEYIIALIKKLFQSDLVSNLKYISTKYLIDELTDAVAILFPRITHTHTQLYPYIINKTYR